MRIAIAAAVACLSIAGVTATAQVHAAIRQHTEIPPEPLDLALRTLAKDRGFQLVYLTENVATLKTRGAVGEFTIDEALKKLLSDSHLEYKFVDDNTVSIFPKTNTTSALDRDGGRASVRNQDSSANASNRSSGELLRLAQVNRGISSDAASVASSSSSASETSTDRVKLEEIVVTAQKKEERLRDVPVPVTVLNTDTLAETNHVLIRDYFDQVPGLSMSPGIVGGQFFAIRGITTGGFSPPTVAIMVDGVPFGPYAGAVGPFNVPDLDPGDLARLEVLRGPQGTLYGAASMGGLINYVTTDPSTDGYSGRVEAGTSGVRHGAEPGFNVRGSINIPISDNLAIRASAYSRQDPGYVDNVLLNRKGVDEAQNDGARLSALWRPADAISLKLSAMYLHTDQDSSPDVVSGLGPLQQNYIAGTARISRTIQDYNAVLKVKLGDVDFTSLTGYFNKTETDSLDFSYLFGQAAQTLFGVSGVPYIAWQKNPTFTQEIRFSGTILKNVDWLAGAFYTFQGYPNYSYSPAENPTTGQIVGIYANFGNYGGPITEIKYRNYSGFLDLTYHFTDRFDVQIGGRESYDSLKVPSFTSGGPLYGAGVGLSDIVSQPFGADSSAFTYLLTPKFKVSPDLMVYARLASGYRPGKQNSPDVVASAGAPLLTKPDKTYNYEVGSKGEFLDHRISVDASLYYIDWKQLQLSLVNPHGIFYNTNGAGAKSEGIEIEVTAKPASGLTIATWIDYDDAVVTQNFPVGSTAYGVPGDRLPYSSRFSANISAEQSFPISNNLTGFAGGMVSFVGDRLGTFTGSSVRQNYPGYSKIDLRAGIGSDSWRASIYVNNVSDKRGLIGGGIGYDPSNAYLYITPRTVGLSLSHQF